MILYMSVAGYVLAGGASRRMGRDKALLPFEGATLIEFIAHQVRDAAGSVTIIAPRHRYPSLSIRIVEDRRPDCGPLAGIETALLDSNADWNLIVACDMPGLSVDLLRDLLYHANEDWDGVMAQTPDNRQHPLCAVYHRRAAATITRALDAGVRKVLDGLKPLKIKVLLAPELRNVNTPAEWAEVVH